MTDNNSIGKDVEKLKPLYLWWECKIMLLLWKTFWQFLKKLNIESPYDPSIPLLCIYKRHENIRPHQNICTHMFIVALVTTPKKKKKKRKQLKCLLTDKWINTNV